MERKKAMWQVGDTISVFVLLMFVFTLRAVLTAADWLLVLQDVSKINEGKQPLYQDDTNKRILNSLDLLSGLDEDALNAKRLQHPQAEMIEQEWVALSSLLSPEVYTVMCSIQTALRPLFETGS